MNGIPKRGRQRGIVGERKWRGHANSNMNSGAARRRYRLGTGSPNRLREYAIYTGTIESSVGLVSVGFWDAAGGDFRSLRGNLAWACHAEHLSRADRIFDRPLYWSLDGRSDRPFQ